jgi:hypothetical protein
MCFCCLFEWTLCYLWTRIPNLQELDSILTVINKYSNLIIALFTVILAIATIYLALETLNMRKIQSMPIIAIQTKPKENEPQIILLSIINCGNGLAKNIRLNTESNFEVTYDRKNNTTVPLYSLGIINRPFDLGAQQNFFFY